MPGGFSFCYHARMDYLATFLEGIVTFVSPCILPMLPLYLAYFAGDASDAVGSGASASQRNGRVLVRVAGFVLGFTIVFVALGALAGTLGALLVQHEAVVNVVCGVIVVVFGLHYAGLLRVPFLDRTVKPQAEVRPRTFFSSMVFGIVFSIGWTPCVGVFLGSALALAAAQGSVARGVLLLLCYSLGLAVPFAISAVAIEKLAGAFDVIKRHYRAINLVCGLLLVAMGVAMATGLLGSWLRAISALA